MLTWSEKRKLYYTSGIIFAFLILIGLPLIFFLYKPASCSDGKKNQGEDGVDCGGKCAILCSADSIEPIVYWQRAFRVSSGVYHLVAYVENPNVRSMAIDSHYEFKVYDGNNILLAEQSGTITLPPKTTTPVFESGIRTGEGIPARVTFEITEPINWKMVGQRDAPKIRILSREFDYTSGFPRLTAIIENQSPYTIPAFDVITVLFGRDGNAITASKSLVDKIGPESEAEAVFTWREYLSGEVAKIDVIPILYPGIHY